jgi:hypothetical protein
MQAEFILSWPDGSFVLVCGDHMNRDRGRAPARCDEYRPKPWHTPAECADCKALPSTGNGEV